MHAAYNKPRMFFLSTLALLTAGISFSMRTIIADASTHFDWVLLDTPPVGFLPDAQLVARLSEDREENSCQDGPWCGSRMRHSAGGGSSARARTTTS